MPRTLLEIEHDLILAEGLWTVEHRYYANEADARTQRRIAAERIQREEARLEAAMERDSLWQRQAVLREMAARQRQVLAESGVLVSGSDVIDRSARRSA